MNLLSLLQITTKFVLYWEDNNVYIPDPSFAVDSEDDPGLSEEEFLGMIRTLVKQFNLLEWIWLNGPGEKSHANITIRLLTVMGLKLLDIWTNW